MSEPTETTDVPVPATDFANALAQLAQGVLGGVEATPDLQILLRAVDWLRANPIQGRVLIGDLTKGY